MGGEKGKCTIKGTAIRDPERGETKKNKRRSRETEAEKHIIKREAEKKRDGSRATEQRQLTKKEDETRRDGCRDKEVEKTDNNEKGGKTDNQKRC